METPERSPEKCPDCGAASVVINSRPRATHRLRVRRCIVCRLSWETYESMISPDDLPSHYISDFYPSHRQ